LWATKNASRFSELFYKSTDLLPNEYRELSISKQVVQALEYLFGIVVGGKAVDKLTFTMENYLEAIYELAKTGTGARLTDIAVRMNVTKATANTAMSILAQRGLITNEKYLPIRLTDAGLKTASIISEKHHIIQRFFIEILNLDFNTANTDACAIEHVISSKSISAMHDFLKKFSGTEYYK
jgi:DtxR family Mn-dependent transcriptional regulator